VEEAVRQEIILLAYEMLVTDFNGKAVSLRLESWLSLPASLTISLLLQRAEATIERLVAEATWPDLLRESQTKIARFNCTLGVLLFYTVMALESARLNDHTTIDHFAPCLFACCRRSLPLLILDSIVFESQISHSVVLESNPPL
jgi:hypothetical protein